jgi:uncharacterized protein (DUF58 family)
VTRRARPTPVGWMALLVAGVLYLAGSNIGSGWVVLLTAALVAGVVLDLRAAARSSRGTQVDAVAGIARTTDRVAVRLEVRRPDAGAALHLADAGDTARCVVRGPAASIGAAVHLPRGHHPTLPLALRTVGPLGLAAATSAPAPAIGVWCRPGARPAAGRLHAILGGAGSDVGGRRSAGDDEVRGVRPFEAGDRRRAVHWRATARQGSLMVRQAEGGRGRRIRLALDGGSWPAGSLDLATEVLVSLAEVAGPAGHVPEVAVDGAVLVWDDAAWQRLAALPPAAGVPARPLLASPGEAAVRIGPAGTGIRVEAGGAARVLADAEEVAAWLAGG